MFRFREVEKKFDDEKNLVGVQQQSEGYKNIKPEGDITYDEAKDFLNSLFK